MLNLLIPMAIVLALAFLRNKIGITGINKKHEKKEILFIFIIVVYLGVFTGLRTWYNDTVTYIQMYEFNTPTLKNFFGSPNNRFSQGLGFLFLNSLMKTFNFSNQDFIMFYGILTMALYVSSIYKHSEDFTFSMFLFFAVGCFVFAQAAIKQSVAMAFGCWAYHYATEKKWKKYILLVALASLFHPYALVYLVMPLMMFQPWTLSGYIWLFASIVVGISLPKMFGVIVDVTTMMGAQNYTVEEFSGAGVNIFRLFVCVAPTLLSFIFKDGLYKDADQKDYLLMNLTMLNGIIMFIGLFGTANYFARLANFFLPFQVLSIPWLVKRLKYSDRALIVLVCVVGYLGYLYYESGILRPFDQSFSQISLWDYLRGLLQ